MREIDKLISKLESVERAAGEEPLTVDLSDCSGNYVTAYVAGQRDMHAYALELADRASRGEPL
jgi:hypothetical protein